MKDDESLRKALDELPASLRDRVEPLIGTNNAGELLPVLRTLHGQLGMFITRMEENIRRREAEEASK